MGLYYSSFLKEVEEMINKEGQITEDSLEVFLDNNMQSICKKYKICVNSLHWAINLQELSKRLNLSLGKYGNRVELLIRENLKGTY